MKITRILNTPWDAAAVAVTALTLANPSAHAAPVWNVNLGPKITTSDNFAGAAPENTANSFWNSVLTATPSNQALSDSTGTATTATLTLTPPGSIPMNYGGHAPVTGLEIFATWMKTDGNATRNGANLRLTFPCLKSTQRGGAALKVQTSSDLGLADPWTNHEAAVPDADGTANGVVFDTTDDGAYIHVIADIPAAGSGLFARLSAVVTP